MLAEVLRAAQAKVQINSEPSISAGSFMENQKATSGNGAAP